MDLDAVFAAAGCTGALLVRCLDDGRELGLRADDLVVLASTVKVLVAVEAETAFADGRLSPGAPVVIDDGARVPGPVGLSLFDHGASVALSDLVVLMLTVSDNTATDLLIEAIGLGAVNARARALGLRSTVLETDIRGQVDSVGRDLGHQDWAGLTQALAGLAPGEQAALDRALPDVTALAPTTATRGTPRDMVDLLAAIWDDTATLPNACARVRGLMRRQLTRHRLASGFPPGIDVAAKSGGLVGVVRNEVGVITYPDGTRYAAAVFTRTPPGADARAVDVAIGVAAQQAVQHLRTT